VDEKGSHPHPKHVKAIQEWDWNKKPNIKQFLGLAQYDSAYIPGFEDIVAPLRRDDKNGTFSEESRYAFEVLKKALTTNLILAPVDFNGQFDLYTDASDTTLGAALLCNRRIVSYWSKKLSDIESKYLIVEKEALAVQLALRNYRYYLYGRKFTLHVDNTNVAANLRNKKLSHNSRLVRMVMDTQEYDVDIVVETSKSNFLAEAMTRMYHEPIRAQLVPRSQIMPMVDQLWQWLDEDNTNLRTAYENEILNAAKMIRSKRKQERLIIKKQQEKKRTRGMSSNIKRARRDKGQGLLLFD
jgi:hypothetical protein